MVEKVPAKRVRKAPVPKFGPNRAAVEVMIQALRDAGKLELVDSARVTAVQSLADVVDSDPSNASIWREYRAALELVRISADGSSIDEFEKLIDALGAEMGDSKKP